MIVSSLTVYPVKSTAGIDLDAADVEVSGLRHDRRWVVVGPDGKRLRAARFPELMRVVACPDDDGTLHLSVDGLEPIVVPVPVGGRRTPVVMSGQTELVDAGDEAADWFARVLGRPARLAWQDDPAGRPVAAEHGGEPGDHLNLSDTGPLLVTTTASLARLDEWIATDQRPQPMDMARFRPNVVVDGAPAAWVEDDWRSLVIGETAFRFAEHCDRCVVTTMDPATLARGPEPLRTLGAHRRREGAVFFGIRVVPLAPGRIAVGDPVVAG